MKRIFTILLGLGTTALAVAYPVVDRWAGDVASRTYTLGPIQGLPLLCLLLLSVGAVFLVKALSARRGEWLLPLIGTLLNLLLAAVLYRQWFFSNRVNLSLAAVFLAMFICGLLHKNKATQE